METGPQSNKPIEANKEKEVNLDDVYLFGRALRKIIETSGKNNTQIGQELGISPASISKWLNADAFPGEDKIKKLAEICCIDYDELNHIFMLSKKAYDAEKRFRKNPKIKTLKKKFWED